MVIEGHKCGSLTDSNLLLKELFEFLEGYFAVIDDPLNSDPGDHEFGLRKLSLPPSKLHLDVCSVLRNRSRNQPVPRPHVDAIFEIGFDLALRVSTLNRMVWWGP